MGIIYKHIVKVHSELASPTELQLDGGGVDSVFLCHKKKKEGMTNTKPLTEGMALYHQLLCTNICTVVIISYSFTHIQTVVLIGYSCTYIHNSGDR